MTVTYKEYRPGRWVKIVNGAAVRPAPAEEVAAWQESLKAGGDLGPLFAWIEKAPAEGDLADERIEGKETTTSKVDSALSHPFSPREETVTTKGDPGRDDQPGAWLWVQNSDDQSHRDFLLSWGLPRYQEKRGRPCTLMLCHPEDLDTLGDLPGVKVRAVTTVHRGTFMLGEEAEH